MPTPHTVRNLLWTALAFVAVVAIVFIYLLTVPAPLERYLQARMLLALRQHYNADVQIENLHVTLLPEFYATADNFVLPNRGGPDLPPLITVKHVTVRAGFLELLRTPVHLSWLKLDGLVIQVSPKRDRPPAAAALPPQPRHRIHLANFVIEKVDADNTELYILRKDPKRDPMEFQLRHLQLHSAGIGQPMNFTADLTNPTPPGLIETSGHFGPWDFDEPSATNVDGHYTFHNADLSVFNGISGILSSVGEYRGILHNIVVDGTTDVPNFQLDHGGEPVHLTTQFHAIVDGTNGNTYLEPVKAHFLNSDVTTSGEVASKPGEHGKTIALAVDMERARVEDVLSLAAKQLAGRLDAESDDVLAALDVVAALPEIDARHIGVMGSSFGGTTSLLAAGKTDRFTCAVDFAGAAMNWDRTPGLRHRMTDAALRLTMPVFFIQAANDYSIRPTIEIAAALEGTGKIVQSRVYPPFGINAHEGHLLESSGPVVWGADLRRFLERHL